MVRRWSTARGFVDQPGGHKGHARPVALGGGAAVTLAVALPVIAGIVAARLLAGSHPDWVPDYLAIHLDGIVANMQIPPGMAVEVVHDEADYGEYLFLIAVAFVLIYMILASVFESLTAPVVIMFSIPLAAAGSFWALIFTKTSLFTAYTITGFLILLGIVVNNGIVLLDHIHNLRKQGLDRSSAILEGCRDRFRPILMTAATTILGLLPLAVGKAAVGDGYYYPMARAIMGGLATSTVLTLVVLPTFYVLSKHASAAVRRTIAWGMGRAAVPWRAVREERS